MTNEATIAVDQSALDWKLPSSRKVAIICLILTETGVFSIFVAAYVFYIGQEFIGPDAARRAGVADIVDDLPAFEQHHDHTCRSALSDRDRLGLFKLFWLATIVLAGLFSPVDRAEWRTLIYQKGLTISTNLFGTTFYSLVGLHASHVIVGMSFFLSLVLIFQSCADT